MRGNTKIKPTGFAETFEDRFERDVYKKLKRIYHRDIKSSSPIRAGDVPRHYWPKDK